MRGKIRRFCLRCRRLWLCYFHKYFIWWPPRIFSKEFSGRHVISSWTRRLLTLPKSSEAVHLKFRLVQKHMSDNCISLLVLQERYAQTPSGPTHIHFKWPTRARIGNSPMLSCPPTSSLPKHCVCRWGRQMVLTSCDKFFGFGGPFWSHWWDRLVHDGPVCGNSGVSRLRIASANRSFNACCIL